MSSIESDDNNNNTKINKSVEKRKKLVHEIHENFDQVKIS